MTNTFINKFSKCYFWKQKVAVRRTGAYTFRTTLNSTEISVKNYKHLLFYLGPQYTEVYYGAHKKVPQQQQNRQRI